MNISLKSRKKFKTWGLTRANGEYINEKARIKKSHSTFLLMELPGTGPMPKALIGEGEGYIVYFTSNYKPKLEWCSGLLCADWTSILASLAKLKGLYSKI